jgi:transposase
MSAVEIVSRIAACRKWRAAEKAALLAEVDAEGGRVTLVARRRRISESLLYNWRSARKAAVAAASGIESPEFLQLGVPGQANTNRPAILAISGAGVIEVDLPNGVRFRVDASVSEKALARVLRAIKDAMRSTWR